MEWQKEAEEAIARVPFFVRKRVRKRIEAEAGRLGSQIVSMEHVNRCKTKYLKNMEDEVKGYRVENCFGQTGCPNRAATDSNLVEKIEEFMIEQNLKAFLKNKVQGPLKMHHEFRISISDCPNACSQPQIADIGIIGACRPMIGSEPCNNCENCTEACKENAISIPDGNLQPIIDFKNCILCGQCVRVCPTETIREFNVGYRILVGGKLGRHPQLATELEGIFSSAEVLSIVKKCVDHFLKHNISGERFGEILNRVPLRLS